MIVSITASPTLRRLTLQVLSKVACDWAAIRVAGQPVAAHRQMSQSGIDR
jgi:hypothetical protein